MNQKNNNGWKIKFLNFVICCLIIIHTGCLFLLSYNLIEDLSAIFEQEIFDDPIFFIFYLIITIILSIPTIFSIGLFWRKNWARIGTIIIAIIGIIIPILNSILYLIINPSLAVTNQAWIEIFIPNMLFLIFYFNIYKYFQSVEIKSIFKKDLHTR